ncbi:MAG: hypothetical protein R3F53_07620 [Gammaproteobacteria bacterium]
MKTVRFWRWQQCPAFTCILPWPAQQAASCPPITFRHSLPFLGGIITVLAKVPWLLDIALMLTYLVYMLALLTLWKNRANHFSGLGDNARQTVNWLLVAILFNSHPASGYFDSHRFGGGGFLKKITDLALFSHHADRFTGIFYTWSAGSPIVI